jgi:hypothetical protein
MYITEKRLLKWALYCNIIYVLLFFLIRPQGIGVQKIGITSLFLFSTIIIIVLSIRNWGRLKEIPKFARGLFSLIIFFGTIVIVRGFSFSLQDWVTNFGNVYMGFAWLVPFTLVLGLKIENWSIVFNAINFMFQLMIFFFFVTLFFIDDYIKWAWLLRPVNFILLVAMYRYGILDKIKIIVIIGIYIFVAVWVEQRMDLLFLFLTFVFLLLDKLFSISIKKQFLKYIFGGFIIVLILIFTVGYEAVSNAIASVIEFQDSRTFLYTELFDELAKTNDQLFGRGSLGTYFSDFMEHTKRYVEEILKIEWWGDASDRITIEVGYLQMVLKGGIALLVLNVSIAIYAIYVALFKSNNKFVKRLGYYILIISILSLVSLRPAFTPTFIIFWMAIGTVLNKKYRFLSNEEINNLISFK